LKKVKVWKVINGEAPVAPDAYDDDAATLSAACREWILETYEEEGNCTKDYF
jgi:hypothetical protein